MKATIIFSICFSIVYCCCVDREKIKKELWLGKIDMSEHWPDLPPMPVVPHPAPQLEISDHTSGDKLYFQSYFLYF